MSLEKESTVVNTERVVRNPQMRLNQEEVRILQECNKESFYYRSLPLAAAAMIATQLAVRRGLLKSHPKWGSAFKLVGAGFLGWFVGKLSYRTSCEEKFLRLQNSQIADSIRRRKGYKPEMLKDDFPGSDEATLNDDDTASLSLYDDYNSSSRSLNLDTDKNIQYSGLDDSDTAKSEFDTQSEEKPQKVFTSYDDLRRKNREDYELRQSKLFQQPSTQSPPASPKDWKNLGDKPQPKQSTENIYGDRWEK